MPKGNEHRAGPAQALTRARIRAFALASFAVLAYATVLASGIVRCPIASLFHVPCPTCGATRSSLALLRGDLSGACLNPLAPPLLLLLGAFAVRLVFVAARDGHAGRFDEGPVIRWLVRALLVTFGLAVVLWGLRFVGWFGGPVPV